MGHIFYLMGKSSSGKDTIYKELIDNEKLNLKTVVPYTTRPMRSGETEGVEYFFVDREKYMSMKNQGIVIESRDYNTVHGIWTYFTADDGQINREDDYILIGTLESFEGLKNFYGSEMLVPLYIEVEDGERLKRALNREMSQDNPKYEEMCRRFLADQKDFCKENLEKNNITKSYQNINLKDCLNEIYDTIKEYSGVDGK